MLLVATASGTAAADADDDVDFLPTPILSFSSSSNDGTACSICRRSLGSCVTGLPEIHSLLSW